ncbi:LOW QUALITY PROTEIN: centrosomal protein 15 [Gasterosteus aculeatus]
MSARAARDTDLAEKHEQILRRRAELLQQRTEGSGEQLRRRRQAEECEAARRRNGALLQVMRAGCCRVPVKALTACSLSLQDLQQIEERLRGTWLPPPHLLALETRYWASVEESLPAWEDFFLGKGPHPAPGTVPPPRRARLPPRQRPRTARLER